MRPIAGLAEAGENPNVSEPPIEWDDESMIILLLMRIEAKLDELIGLFEDDGDGEEATDT
jgi:hypothetical protein